MINSKQGDRKTDTLIINNIIIRRQAKNKIEIDELIDMDRSSPSF